MDPDGDWWHLDTHLGSGRKRNLSILQVYPDDALWAGLPMCPQKMSSLLFQQNSSLDGYFHVWFYMEIKRIEIKIENLEYFFYNLEKAWSILSWLTRTISSKSILSQRRKPIQPTRRPIPPRTA